MKITKIKSTISVLMTLVVCTAWGNNERYRSAMILQIENLYEAESIDAYQLVVNAFERIGEAEGNHWEPFYYASFGYIMMANLETDAKGKDAFLDQAIVALNAAKSVEPEESEIVALEGFIHMIRLTVDPQSRGAQYSALAMKSFGRAIELNPDNPRALYLVAQMQFGTAKFFGTSTQEACKTATAAIDKFAEASNDDPIAPNWGERMAMEFVKSCE